MFSSDEIFRYSRHLSLPDFSEKDQIAIKNAKVLVIGCGGLGSPVLQYLYAIGIGNIGIVDDDTVDLSNLQRQVLFRTADVGKQKAVVAASYLNEINPYVHTTVITNRITSDNALSILANYDVVIDGSDNLPTRYLINDAAIFCGIPLVHGSIFRYEGQVAVFNFTNKDGERSANYRDIFPEPPPPSMVPSCAEGGVLGILPGIIGTLMANEVIKIIRGQIPSLIDKVLLVDAQSLEFRKIKIRKRKDNPLTGAQPSITELIDYEVFCQSGLPEIKVIDWATLQLWKDTDQSFVLIDVREKSEYDHENIGGMSIPLSTIKEHKDLFDADLPYVIHCQSGKRSKKAIAILEESGINRDFYNLRGGIEAVIGNV